MIDKYKDNLKSLLSQGFSEKAVEDLAKSGLTLETIQRMGLLPLTSENFKEYVHFSLIEKNTRSQIVNDGYIIPYHHVTPKFGRVKVIEWNEGSAYYQKIKDNPPKYLQPSKQHLERTVHVYFLPGIEKKLKSPKAVYFITEGEKKTAKLQQELEKLETDHRKFAVLGLGGVWNWDEEVFKEVKADFRDREVCICFDADGIYNPNVARAELTLYSYLLSCGAVSVKSLHWNIEEGKGVDDYLVKEEEKGRAPEEVLEELYSSAVSPIEKYRKVVGIDTVIECLTKYLNELSNNLLLEIKKAYGEDKREIKKKFKEAVRKKREELEEKLKREEKEELLRIYQSLFGIDYVPEFPKGYRIEKGLLYFGDEDICDAFVVSEVGENIDEIDGGYLAVLKFINGKRVRVSSNIIASSKLLVNYLQQEKIAVSERESKRVQDYVAKFIRKNKERIKRSCYSTRIGWSRMDGEETYVHPTVSNISLLTGKEVEEKLKKSGNKEKEIKVIRNLISGYPHAGLLWVMGVCASVIYPILGDDCNLVVFVQGETGTGKTTAIKTAVSFYASPTLKRAFNFSEGGFEGFISSLKDFPIHLEEVKELDKNPVRRAEKFVDFVYKFVEGVGRTRMKIDLTLRNAATYRGLIFTSSEMGIDEILSHSSDSYYEGIFRRVLVVPASRERFGGENLGRLVHFLSENYGNLLPEWIKYFKENKEGIIEKFKERDADFSEVYKLDAKVRRFLTLVSVVMEEIGELFKIDTLPLWDALEEVGVFNEKLYREYILGDEESFKERVEEFLSGVSTTGTIVELENIYGRVEVTLRDCKKEFLVYRRIQKDNGKIISVENFLTAKGLKALSIYFGMGKNLLLEKLKEFNLIGKRRKETVLAIGDRVNLYPLFVESKESNDNEVQEQESDSIDF